MKLKQPDVLVAGAGPVGMLTALRLAREGLSVQVVEKAPGPSNHSYALALHPGTLELLDELGIAGPVLESALPVRTIGLYEGRDRKASLDLGALGGKFPYVAALEQGQLERQLVEALARAKVDILWSHRLAAFDQDVDGVDVRIDELSQRMTGYAFAHLEWMVERSRKDRVPFLVGADGHGSIVRLQSNASFGEVAPAEHFAVFEFHTKGKVDAEMRLVLEDDTSNVLWPLPGGVQRWSFQLTDVEVSKYSRDKDQLLVQHGVGGYPLLEREHLNELLKSRAPWFDPASVGEIRWRILVRFEKRIAARFGQGRVWMVGDAVHMTGPAGMQSMNIGMLEGAELSTRLAAAVRGGGLAELEPHHDRWHAQWRFLLGQENGLQPIGSPDTWAGQRAARLLPCLPASGDALRALAAQLKLG